MVAFLRSVKTGIVDGLYAKVIQDLTHELFVLLQAIVVEVDGL